MTDGRITLVRDRRQPASPLLKAVKRNARIEIVQKLLKIGCDVERPDEKLNRAIHCAAHYGNSNNCRQIVNANANLNVANHLGRTPLHFAARSGHPRVVKMLLKEKVEVNAEDNFGQTPLSVACDTQIQKLLKEGILRDMT